MKGLNALLLLAFILSSSVMVSIPYSYPPQVSADINTGDPPSPSPFQDEALLSHIQKFSSLGSRVSGYPGSEEAAKYIMDYFNKTLGLEVVVQDYPVAVPVDEGSYIEVISPSPHNFSAYAFWPNYVQASTAPPEGISGKLVYVGEGDLKDFDYKTVEDSILLMDIDSGYNWLNGVNFGAKAVIFIEAEAHRYEFSKKLLRNPIYVPRLYVSVEDGYALKNLAGEGAVVSVHSNMQYRNRNAKNVIGILEGRSADNVIIVSTHYDDWSAVPRKAPGADESSGIASLLELARYYTEAPAPPYNTIWFVAFSGHWQGLAGPREFVEKFLFSSKSSRTQLKCGCR